MAFNTDDTQFIELPANLHPDELFLYCELTAISDTSNGNQKVDFSGLKTYKISFIKDGVGFGITNIRIELSPTLQPEILITFKDFYGNLAFTNTANAKDNQEQINFLTNVNNGPGINDFNYAVIFNQPFPKFKLVLKGFLGQPVAWELNIKKIDTAIVPNDGAYEIKATFIPNLYGFFADIPYNFLLAVKALKLSGMSDEQKKEFTKNYVSIFDLPNVGKTIEQQQSVIENSLGNIPEILNSLQSGNLTDDIINLNWFDPSVPAIKGNDVFKDLYLRIDTIAGKSNPAKLDLKNQYAKKSLLNSQLKTRILQNIVASLTRTPNDTSKTFDVFAKPPVGDLSTGNAHIVEALKAIEDYKKNQLGRSQGIAEKIQQITIKNVFDSLIKDSSFLLGKILEAGYKGFTEKKDNRFTDDNAIGNYYPLTSGSNKEEIPYTQNSTEFKFTNSFINALVEGSVENVRKSSSDNNNVASETPIKRIHSLELKSKNPYNILNSQSFIMNLLERSGIISSMYDDFSGSIITTSKYSDLISSEVNNINIGLKKIDTSSSDKQILLSFCQKILSLFDSAGNVLNPENKQFIASPNFNKVRLLKFADSNDVIGYLNNYIGNIDPTTYQSKGILHNGLAYFIPNLDDDYYILFKNDENNILDGLLANKGYDSGSLDVKQISSDTDDVGSFFSQFNGSFKDFIEDNKILDYNKLNILSNDINSYLVKYSTDIDRRTDAESKKLYIGVYKNVDSNLVWDLFGNTSQATMQRRFMYDVCSKIQGSLKVIEKDKKDQIKDVEQKVRQGFNTFYKQFHVICNNWKNLVDEKTDFSKFEDMVISDSAGTGTINRVIYSMPLQEQQDNGVKIENAIINTEPLSDTNSQTTVFNVMANICTLNNFMFLSIPGNGLVSASDYKELFQPFTQSVRDNIAINNFFYVMWMPTPESRTSFNNNDPIYHKFDPNLANKNKIFKIDFGSINNTIVKSLNMTTEENKVTSESIFAVQNLVDQKNSNKVKSLDCSMLSVYEGRSYKINCEIIGNARIIPTQFCLINSIPIFNGLYQIMKVEHNVSQNNMTTRFEAIKMKYDGNQSFVYVPPITLENYGIVSGDFANQSGTSPQVIIDNKDFLKKYKDDRYSYTKSKEGLRLKPYPDAGSFSIGYGHLLKQDLINNFLQIGNEKLDISDVMSNGITKKQAEDLFKQDADIRENQIIQKVPNYSSISENKKGAIFSYYYNTGRLPENLNTNLITNNDSAVADSLRNGIKTVQGQVFQPLVVRREEEALLYQI